VFCFHPMKNLQKMPDTDEMDTDQQQEDLRVVMPGDVILTAKEIKKENKRLILGPGLKSEQDNIVSTKAGILRKKQPNTYWIDSYQKR
jgi:exosome complex RNA-binding protein Rrp4